MKRRSEPTDPTALTPLRVLVVEDDDFQLTIACMTLETAARGAGVALSIETSDTGLFALEECRSHQQPFDLVLMDFILSDHTASSHLPAIRAQLGQTAAIVMLSAADEELQLTRCLDLGADAYRIKPLTFNMAVELFSYGREKRDFFRKRRRTLHPSVTESETELALGGSASPLRDPEEPDAPGRSFTMLSAGDNVFMSEFDGAMRSLQERTPPLLPISRNVDALDLDAFNLRVATPPPPASRQAREDALWDTLSRSGIIPTDLES